MAEAGDRGHPAGEGRTALALFGAVPLLTAYPAYLLGSLLNSQTGLLRTAGVLAIAALASGAAAATLGGLLGCCRPANHPSWRKGATIALLAGIFINLAAIGLALWHRSAPAAPLHFKAAAALVVLLLTANLARADRADREAVAGAMIKVGLFVQAVALACLPVVAIAAWRDVPALPGRPEAPSRPAIKEDAPRRIVLITFDGLRARSTSLHRPSLDTTPSMKALAKQAVWFSNLRAAGDQTVVSMPAILTGVAPSRLYAEVRHRSGALREGAVHSLAGFLRQAGYRTRYATMFIRPGVFSLSHEFDAGTSTAGFLPSVEFNSRSFLPLSEAADWVRRKVVRGGGGPTEREETDVLSATRVTLDRALGALRSEPGPTFMWVHLGVPHAPFIDVPPDALGSPLRRHDFPLIHPRTDLPANFPRYERAMENFVRFGDHELGRFLVALQADDGWRGTLLVVTSDHGVELLPNRDIHGNGVLTEDVAHVPLLIHGPGATRPLRDDGLAAHVDIAPTILSQVYETLPTGFDGVPLLGRRPAPHRTVFSWGLYGRQVEGGTDPANVAAYKGRYKYVLSLPTRRDALYDLAADPSASRDVSAAHPTEAATLHRLAERYLMGDQPACGPQ